MAKKFVIPSVDEVEELFREVDETGHSNKEKAVNQRKRRKEMGVAVEIDPLSQDDPSGANTEKAIRRTAVLSVLIILFLVVGAQVSYGIARRTNTANLAREVSYKTISSALEGGVGWGKGFTQFPDEFKVIEANEKTGRVEVSVVDTYSENEMEAFAGAQVQATAFSVNALLNPNINTVVYNVDFHTNPEGQTQTSKLFGFLRPTGKVKSFMTFVWTKHATESGVNFSCSLTGVSDSLMQQLKDRSSMTLTESLFGPSTKKDLYSYKTEFVGDNSKTVAIASGMDYTKDYTYKGIAIKDDTEGKTLVVELNANGRVKDVDLSKQATMTFALIGNVDSIQYINTEDESTIVSYTRDELDKKLQKESAGKLSLKVIGDSEESFNAYKEGK